MGAAESRAAHGMESFYPRPSSVIQLGCPVHGEVRRPEFGHNHRASEGELGTDSSTASVSSDDMDDLRGPMDEDPWGWFEETEERGGAATRQGLSRRNSLHEITETPGYILEESLETQALWHVTAGKRPKQPPETRQHYEELWSENFKRSQVRYAGEGGGRAKRRRSSEASAPSKKREIIDKAMCPYGYAASKSFCCPHCGHITSLMIHVPKLRVVRTAGGKVFAEFLVIVHNGELTFGVWRRHTDFKNFHRALQRREDRWRFRKSLVKWQEISTKLKWGRCLERGYLVLKCFMLERFLQQVLADSADTMYLGQLLDLNK